MAVSDPSSLLKMEPMRDDDKSSHRKANKPLMEKRRRARINRSLSELKLILVDNLKKSTPGHSKWEKADILEMTVHYVQCLKNQKQASNTDPLAVGQFIAGFSECIRQLKKFGSENEEKAWDESLEGRLTEFLLGYLKNFSDDATRTFGKTHLSSATSPRPSSRLKIIPGGEGQSVLRGSPSSQGSNHSPTSGSLSPNPGPLSPAHDSTASSLLSDTSPTTHHPPSLPTSSTLIHPQPYLQLSIPQLPPSAQLPGLGQFSENVRNGPIQQPFTNLQPGRAATFSDIQAQIMGNEELKLQFPPGHPILNPQARPQPYPSLLAQQLQQQITNAPIDSVYSARQLLPTGQMIPEPHKIHQRDLHSYPGSHSSLWRPW